MALALFGIKETGRLISRLRRRHFGVLVTTSYISAQAYAEVREDRHPIVLMTGSDIAIILQVKRIKDEAAVKAWLDSVVG